MQLRQRQGQRPHQTFAEETASAGGHDLDLASPREDV
jgi:hypothetical protein